jgi:hypothetical protein
MLVRYDLASFASNVIVYVQVPTISGARTMRMKTLKGQEEYGATCQTVSRGF